MRPSRPGRPRILQLVTSTRRRGAETFAVELGDALRQRDIEVSTMALVATGGVAAMQLPALGTSRWSVHSLRLLRRAIREADLVIAHGSSTLPAVAIASIGTGVPFVYRLIGDPRYWSAGWSRQARVGLLLRRARAIAVYFPAAATALVERYRLPAKRVVVIPKGLALERFGEPGADQRAAARESLDLDRDQKVVALVGALSNEKRPGLAIDAVKQLPDVALVVAGDGPLRSDLEAAIAPGDDRVRFIGAVTDPRPVYQAADAVLLTSRTEGIPGVLIEAALSARPVVTTDVGGVRQVVEDGVTGFIVDATPTAIADGLELALASAESLGAAARERACREFGLDPVADQWAALIHDLVRDA